MYLKTTSQKQKVKLMLPTHHFILVRWKFYFCSNILAKLSQLNQNKAIRFSFTLVSTQSNNRTERMAEIGFTKTKLASFNVH